MALPTSHSLTTAPTAVGGLSVGTAYQVQVRKTNYAMVEVATAAPDVDSLTALYVGRNDWAVVIRDESAEGVYVWNAAGAGHVVINEVISNA